MYTFYDDRNLCHHDDNFLVSLLLSLFRKVHYALGLGQAQNHTDGDFFLLSIESGESNFVMSKDRSNENYDCDLNNLSQLSVLTHCEK